MAKTYRKFIEAVCLKSWKDMKDRNVLKAAEKFKKKMKDGNVLGYTLSHGEFTIFKDDKEFNDSVKNAKDMKWIRVE
tara:strand:+ start:1745 stop:1975 length:231 start_codon:yes stop_codon:yes gene_type:complete